MSSITNRLHEVNGHVHIPLILRTDSRHQIYPSELNDDRRQEIQRLCAESTVRPVFLINGLLTWTDEERWMVLKLIATIPNASVTVAEAADPTDLLGAVVELMVGTSDPDHCGRGHRAAVQAAALTHPTEAAVCASRISDRLRELGVSGARDDPSVSGRQGGAAAVLRLTKRNHVVLK